MPLPNIRRVTRRRRTRRGVEQGWVVTIVRRDTDGARQRVARNFHDATYGGPAQAFAAAKAFRDRTLKRLPPPTRTKSTFGPNTTGVVGVALVREKMRSGRTVLRYAATWFDAEGHRRRATFSIARYGRTKAFRLAVAARTTGLKARFGRHARTLGLLTKERH